VCVSDFAQNSTRWELRFKTAFQEEALSHEKDIDWLHCCKDGCTSTESDGHPGYPSSSGNDEVIATMHVLVIAVQIIPIKKVAEEQGISFGSC
jgi:hypothetical protein